ncbi:MAG: SGNH/GDSL hydrolase family protein [Vicinamibacteria bacterium]
MSALPLHKKILFWAILVALPASCAAGLWALWRSRHFDLPSGKKLNKAAWVASFSERGQRVPEDGPRDGFWGNRMPPWTRDPEVGWHESETHIPRLVEQDSLGLQRIEADGARCHVLILGGSVAWGAYASTIKATYFGQLVSRLAESGHPVRVTVMAAGAWTSENELKAMRSRGLALAPDVVVFLNGMNDLTQGRDIAEEARVRGYLDHMHEARDVAETKGILAVFALQPALHGKRHKTPLEQRIQELMADKAAFVPTAYPVMRDGLRGLASHAGTAVVDCSDAFSGERATTFTDIWHFADPGHRLLAECLAGGLLPILDAEMSRKRHALLGRASRVIL